MNLSSDYYVRVSSKDIVLLLTGEGQPPNILAHRRAQGSREQRSRRKLDAGLQRSELQ